MRMLVKSKQMVIDFLQPRLTAAEHAITIECIHVVIENLRRRMLYGIMPLERGLECLTTETKQLRQIEEEFSSSVNIILGQDKVLLDDE